MVDSDEKLVGRVIEGDKAAFEELVFRHRQPILAMIRREVSDQHYRDDVLQETLLYAWKDIRQLRKPSCVRAWLISIARNRCRDLYKSASKHEQVTEPKAMEIHINRLGRSMGDSRDRESAVEAMNRVPDTQRQVAEMFYLDGLTVREIAKKLEKAEGTVKSRLYHARRYIGRYLKPE